MSIYHRSIFYNFSENVGLLFFQSKLEENYELYNVKNKNKKLPN